MAVERHRTKPGPEVNVLQWTGSNFEEVLDFLSDDQGTFNHLPADASYTNPTLVNTQGVEFLVVPNSTGAIVLTPGDSMIQLDDRSKDVEAIDSVRLAAIYEVVVGP